MNHDSGLGTEPAHQKHQISGLQGDAASGRSKAWPRLMDEHGTAPARNTRAGVVIDFNDNVVQAILAPKPIAWFSGRPTERPIVAAITRIFAPGVSRGDWPGRQLGLWPRRTVWAPP